MAIARSMWLAICGFHIAVAALPATRAAEPTIRIDTPMSPPAWALLERELLRANAAACREFYDKYFDERGFLLCVERWGGRRRAGRRD